MKKKLILIAMVLLGANLGFAQSDVDNLAKARAALVKDKNCDDANRYLTQVSPDYRLTTDYMLSMAMVQDCKKNNEQALYYYRKVLEQQPANDSVKKRVAELSDMQSHKNGGVTTSYVSAKTGNKSSHHKKKKKLNLYDNYCTIGMGYGVELGGADAPYGGEIDVNASSGFLIAHEKMVLGLEEDLAFLTNPNNTWFDNALQSGPSSSGTAGGGFAERLSMGLYPILVNKTKLSLTAGVFGGFNFMLFPQMTNTYSANSVGDQASFCYGIKSCLFLGQNVMLYAKLLLNTKNTADVQTSFGDYTVPANYNSVSIGINYKFEPFWWWF